MRGRFAGTPAVHTKDARYALSRARVNARRALRGPCSSRLTHLLIASEELQVAYAHGRDARPSEADRAKRRAMSASLTEVRSAFSRQCLCAKGKKR